MLKLILFGICLSCVLILSVVPALYGFFHILGILHLTFILVTVSGMFMEDAE